MLRIVISLFVSLPMLMPPGMCLCEFLPCPDASAADSKLNTSEEESDCQCRCGHGHLRSARKGKGTGSQTLTRAAATGRHESDPIPQPETHHPGCPASIGPISDQFVNQTNAVGLLPVAKMLELLTTPVAQRPSWFDNSKSGAFRSCPRFIVQCTLLI
jgi:hypothetical protein